jgi:hypothetical protein
MQTANLIALDLIILTLLFMGTNYEAPHTIKNIYLCISLSITFPHKVTQSGLFTTVYPTQTLHVFLVFPFATHHLPMVTPHSKIIAKFMKRTVS